MLPGSSGYDRKSAKRVFRLDVRWGAGYNLGQDHLCIELAKTEKSVYTTGKRAGVGKANDLDEMFVLVLQASEEVIRSAAA